MLVLAWFPSIPLLYGLVILGSFTASFFEPARSALLPDIVKPEELTAANALGAALWSTMLALGSAAGGLMTAWLGWQAAIVFDAGTYLLSLVLVAGIVEPAWERASGSSLRDALRELVDGLNYVLKHPRVRSLAMVKFGWSLAGSSTLVLTMMGERTFTAVSPLLAVTALYVARGVGTGLGPFLARAISQSEPKAMERLIAVGFLVGGAFYLVLGHAPGLALALGAVVLAHLGGATAWVFSTIRLQQIVPTAWRGRVFAFEHALFTVAIAASTAAFGAMIDAGLRLDHATALMGAILLSGAVWWTFRGMRLGWATEP
jgi:predicted MFS family arabinose efflux permease